MSEAQGPPDPQLVVTLDKPIEMGGARYDQIVLREPTVREVRHSEGFIRNSVNPETIRLRDVNLVAAVSGWTAPAVEMLPISIFNRAIEYLWRFIQPGPATGAN